MAATGIVMVTAMVVVIQAASIKAKWTRERICAPLEHHWVMVNV